MGQPGGGNAQKGCKFCFGEHPDTACPTKAARDEGVSEKLIADSARTGQTCSICGRADHRKKHHDMAYKKHLGIDVTATLADGKGNQRGKAAVVVSLLTSTDAEGLARQSSMLCRHASQSLKQRHGRTTDECPGSWPSQWWLFNQCSCCGMG